MCPCRRAASRCRRNRCPPRSRRSRFKTPWICAATAPATSKYVTPVRPGGERVPPQPLPPAFASVPVQDAVDLRKHCTPVGDQGQTSRCAAFAWTHAAELVANMKNGDTPRLSPSFTMLEFQRMQGDAQDYAYAHSGGDGTINGPDAGRVLAEEGTCRQELWPDESEVPVTSERVLTAGAERHRLEGTP